MGADSVTECEPAEAHICEPSRICLQATTRREQMSQMVAHIPHDTALAFPGYAAAPLYRQTQAEHLRVAPLCRRTTTSGHAGRDVTLVKIVHDDIQCYQEGFEIEFHGHVSFGERVDMAVDSRRNLPLLSSE